MSLIPTQLHPTWKAFLSEEIMILLDRIEASIGDETNPPKPFILRFMTTDLNALKIIILGQDPYPQKGVATGRSFEAGTLTAWDKPFKQVSLKNIVRLIYKDYNGIEAYSAIPSYSDVAKEIRSGDFRIAPPSQLFSNLEAQGVLFLNTWLSIKPGEPQSHRHQWQPFAEKLLRFISAQKPDLIWFLWGKSAQDFKPFITKGTFYESRHPMMCSESYPDDFLKSKCFKETMPFISWTGK
ncbi:MAG: uracil-DNA glycosylase [Clostridia bacterium]|nr:uracil-DNA glycosylase [Clostridia bacterium]